MYIYICHMHKTYRNNIMIGIFRVGKSLHDFLILMKLKSIEYIFQ